MQHRRLPSAFSTHATRRSATPDQCDGYPSRKRPSLHPWPSFLGRAHGWLTYTRKSRELVVICHLKSNETDTDSRFSPILTYINIPAHRNAQIKKSPADSKRWPVIVFSHGLAGSRNLYSHICGSLASYGVVVVALDHRDGSSPVQHVRATKDTAEQIVASIKISHDPVPETYKARDRQLRIRLDEIALAFNALARIDQGEVLDNLDLNNSTSKKERVEVLTYFRDMLDIHRPGAVTWVGHSFGAATIVQLVKSVYYASKAPKNPEKTLFTPEPGSLLAEQITSSSPIALLDLWGLPLQSPDTSWLAQRPMPAYRPSGAAKKGGHALLCVFSEAFHEWTSNRAQVQKALRPPSAPRSSTSTSSSKPKKDSSSSSSSSSAAVAAAYSGPEARLFKPQHSEHFSQSDIGVLFPRLTGAFTRAQDPEYVLELNARAVLQLMRENGVCVSESRVTSVGSTAPATTPTTGVTGATGARESKRVAPRTVEDDSAILARPEEIIGWEKVELDDEAASASAARLAAGAAGGDDKPAEPMMGAEDRDDKPAVVTDAAGKVA